MMSKRNHVHYYKVNELGGGGASPSTPPGHTVLARNDYVGVGGLDELVYWGARVRKEIDDGNPYEKGWVKRTSTWEVDWKIHGLRRLEAVRDSLLSDSPEWHQLLQDSFKAGSTSKAGGLKDMFGWRELAEFQGPLLDPANRSQLAKLLRTVWADDTTPWPEVAAPLVEGLVDIIPRQGPRLKVATILSSAVEPQNRFPFAPTAFRLAYKFSGYPSPAKKPTAMEALRGAAHFVDDVRERATELGVDVPHALSAQVLIWYATRYGTKQESVEKLGWTQEDIQAYAEFAGFRTPANKPAWKVSADEAQDIDRELAKETEPDEPSDSHDAHKRVMRSILARRGQAKFRKKLLGLYGGRCAISGCEAEYALEAAHINAVADGGANHIGNGILLRSDLHTLFDLRRLSVNPTTWKVVLHPELRSGHYAQLHGKSIRLPEEADGHPNADAMRDHRRRCRF